MKVAERLAEERRAVEVIKRCIKLRWHKGYIMSQLHMECQIYWDNDKLNRIAKKYKLKFPTGDAKRRTVGS